MRLDQRLVDLGLAPTRARARDLVKRGFVTVAGVPCEKPGREIPPAAAVAIAATAPDFVSRGAEKLLAALAAFALDAEGAVALDIGASTGGFTEALLRSGARRVYAVDVGHGQLHERLRRDPRVVSLEGQDARTITHEQIGEPVGVIVADVSFISLAKVLDAALALAAPGAWLVALIKPQFEVGPERIGKGGIVRDGAAQADAVRAVESWLAAKPGWRVLGTMPSPMLGGSGNAEFLIAARRNG
jgi:23S rRNA (cytidine1920-2'-O)/16S rRNA (cytidine1409-2'-O)-methyltransferase